MSFAAVQGSDRAIAWSEIHVSHRPVTSRTQQLATRARRHQLRGSTGASSLYHAALWSTLRHLDDLSASHLIELPGSVLADLQKTARFVPRLMQLAHWKTFMSLEALRDLEMPFKWVGESDGLRMAERVRLLSAPVDMPGAWLVDLSLSRVPLLSGEMMQLQHLPNLATLRVEGFHAEPATWLLDDYMLRNFARLALRGLGFSKLQVMLLSGLLGVTPKSLAYLNAFPMITVFQLIPCYPRSCIVRPPGSWELLEAADHVHQALAKGWVVTSGPWDNATIHSKTEVSHWANWIGDENDMTTMRKWQTPSGKPSGFDGTWSQTLSYHVGGNRHTGLGDMHKALCVCSVGGHMHDPQTWIAVGLKEDAETKRDGNKGTRPQQKPTRALKRKANPDETLQDMFS